MLDRIPTIILVAIGGILGASLRYYVSGITPQYYGLPLGTLVVNVSGSFFLGWFMTYAKLGLIDQSYVALIGVGFFGSFTTMSSFSVETMFLSDESMYLALTNIFVMLLGVLFGALIGRVIALFMYSRVI